MKKERNTNQGKIIKVDKRKCKCMIGKDGELIKGIEKYSLNYLVISETKRKEKGGIRLNKCYWLFQAGVNQEERAMEKVDQ